MTHVLKLHCISPNATLQQCSEWIQEIEDKQNAGIDTSSDGRSTYFDTLLSTKNTKMYHKLSREALVDEALALCFAGTDTTSFGLTFGTYYLLRHPDKLDKVLEELKTVDTNSEGLYEYRDISSLPYLVRGSFSAWFWGYVTDL